MKLGPKSAEIRGLRRHHFAISFPITATRAPRLIYSLDPGTRQKAMSKQPSIPISLRSLGEAAEKDADIIFVHGLTGSAAKTWGETQESPNICRDLSRPGLSTLASACSALLILSESRRSSHSVR